MNSASLARRPSLPDIGSATLPVSYERAKTALATCTEIDECKDWADKAAALASYAKQSDDPTLHNFATRIQARAVRRCGELLKTFEKQGARTDQLPAGDHRKLTQREAAKSAGMSEHQEHQAVRVANVSAKEFDAAIETEHPATVTRLAELGKTSKPAPPGFIDATHVIGTVKEFAGAVQRLAASGVTRPGRPIQVGWGRAPSPSGKVEPAPRLVSWWLDQPREHFTERAEQERPAMALGRFGPIDKPAQ